MDEELFRLVSIGLLAAIALWSLIAVALLGRMNKKLDRLSPASVDQPVSEPQQEQSSEPASEAPVETPVPALEGSDGDGPFEKDGRWWYRRDDELLVYDDRTEQWVEPEVHPLEDARGWDTAPVETSPAPVQPAPDPIPEPVAQPTPEPAAAAPEPVVAAPIVEPVDPPAPITETGEQEAPQQMGTHWKCPACGVINGSTATSCRMCFAARP